MACAPHRTSGDSLANKGDWERAYVQYKIESSRAPNDADLDEKVKEAGKQVSQLWVKRGRDAAKDARLADAADWWRRATLLDPGCEGRNELVGHDSDLVALGAAAVEKHHWGDAAKAYQALLVVHPDDHDYVIAADDAGRKRAAELADRAQELDKKGMPGAALLADLDALRLSPLDPAVSRHAEAMKKVLAVKTTVGTAPPSVTAKAAPALGAAVKARLAGVDTPPFSSAKPKDAKQPKASLAIEILDAGWKDEATHGIDFHVGTGTPGAARIARQWVEDRLEAELGAMHVPPLTSAPVPQRKPTAADLAKKKKEIAEAKTAVAGAGDTTGWYHPWAEVTRHATATVRFTLTESDHSAPIVVEQTVPVDVTDRYEDADLEHGITGHMLELPSPEELVGRLADPLAAIGRSLYDKARARRTGELVQRGREADTALTHDRAIDAQVAEGDRSGRRRRQYADDDLSAEQAIDAWVQAVAVAGLAGLPPDAAAEVVAKLDLDDLDQLVPSR